MDNSTTQADEVKVTQADRQAMVDYENTRPIPLAAGFADSILHGNCDDDSRVLAFARHRQSSQPLEPQGEAVAWHTKAIALELEEGSGVWKPCSGCQESSDGYVSTKDYPYNETFRCQPGSGCRECGGLGVLWDDTDYEAYARFCMEEPQPQAGGEELREVLAFLRKLPVGEYPGRGYNGKLATAKRWQDALAAIPKVSTSEARGRG